MCARRRPTSAPMSCCRVSSPSRALGLRNSVRTYAAPTPVREGGEAQQDPTPASAAEVAGGSASARRTPRPSERGAGRRLIALSPVVPQPPKEPLGDCSEGLSIPCFAWSELVRPEGVGLGRLGRGDPRFVPLSTHGSGLCDRLFDRPPPIGLVPRVEAASPALHPRDQSVFNPDSTRRLTKSRRMGGRVMTVQSAVVRNAG